MRDFGIFGEILREYRGVPLTGRYARSGVRILWCGTGEIFLGNFGIFWEILREYRGAAMQSKPISQNLSIAHAPLRGLQSVAVIFRCYMLYPAFFRMPYASANPRST